MKKSKLLVAMLLVSSFLFTGCATSFNEAIGNVSEQGLLNSSIVTLNDTGISTKIGKLTAYLKQFNVESSTLQANPKQLYDSTLWTEQLVQSSKEEILNQLKNLVVLVDAAKKDGFTISEMDKLNIERTVKTQLGQTYRNVLSEFFADKGFPLTESILIEFLTLNATAEQYKVKLMEKTEVDNNIDHVVKFDQYIIPTNGNAEGAKATTDKIKQDLESNRSSDEIVSEYSVNKQEGIEVEGIDSTYVSPDIQKNILAMSKDETKIFEYKVDDNLLAYYVIKVTDVNSEEAKQEAMQRALPIAKQEKVNKFIQDLIAQVNVNENLLDTFKFDTNSNFWKKFDDSQLTYKAN